MSPANIEKNRSASKTRNETNPEFVESFESADVTGHDPPNPATSTTTQALAPAFTPTPAQQPSAAKPLRQPRGRRPMSEAQKAALARGREKRKEIMAERAKVREAERKKRREVFLAEQRERRRIQEQERRKAAEEKEDRKWAKKRARKEEVKKPGKVIDTAHDSHPDDVSDDVSDKDHDRNNNNDDDDDSQYTEESVSVTLGSQDSPDYKPKYHTSQVAKFEKQYIPPKPVLRRSYHYDIEPRPTKQSAQSAQLPALNFL